MICFESTNPDHPQIGPVFACDACREKIEHPTFGVAVFSGKRTGRGETLAAFHVHKGRCHDKVERILTEGRGGPWHELADHVGELVEGSGMSLAAMLGRELDWTGALTFEERTEVGRKFRELADYLREREFESPLLGRIFDAMGLDEG